MESLAWTPSPWAENRLPGVPPIIHPALLFPSDYPHYCCYCHSGYSKWPHIIVKGFVLYSNMCNASFIHSRLICSDIKQTLPTNGEPPVGPRVGYAIEDLHLSTNRIPACLLRRLWALPGIPGEEMWAESSFQGRKQSWKKIRMVQGDTQEKETAGFQGYEWPATLSHSSCCITKITRLY